QDQLDVLFRSVANNQTIGLPIGPDTSRLMAEVILGRIDTTLRQKFRSLRGLRFIDDYELVVNSRSEADAVLMELQRLLNEYELELNPAKTAIIALPTELTGCGPHNSGLSSSGAPVTQRRRPSFREVISSPTSGWC